MARTGLPSSVEALQEMILRQQLLLDAKDEEIVAPRSTIETQAELIAYLQEWKRLIDSQRFGSKSEKASPDQSPPFNEAEIEAAAADDDDLEEDTIAVP